MIKFIIYVIILAVIYRWVVARPVSARKPSYRSKVNKLLNRQNNDDYIDYEEVKE